MFGLVNKSARPRCADCTFFSCTLGAAEKIGQHTKKPSGSFASSPLYADADAREVGGHTRCVERADFT